MRSADEIAYATGTVMSGDALSAPFIDLAAEAETDRIALVGTGRDNTTGHARIRVGMWTGSAWANTATEFVSTVTHAGTGDMAAGVVWVGESGIAAATFTDSTSNAVSWIKWTESAGWASQTDWALSGIGIAQSVFAETFKTEDKAIFLVSDANSDLYSFAYDGTNWVYLNSSSTLENNLASIGTAPFSLTVKSPPSSIGFQSDTSSINEGDGTASVMLLLSRVSSEDVTVQYSVHASSSAYGNGVDYTLASGTSTITAGNTTTSISVSITDDTGRESSEDLIILLTVPRSASHGSSTHAITIVDDDSDSDAWWNSSWGYRKN